MALTMDEVTANCMEMIGYTGEGRSEEYAENTFNKDNAYFVLNAENTYDLYVDSVYVSTVTKVFDPKIPIKEE